MHIYTTGGLGDVIAIESHMEEPPDRIYWASRARPDLEPLYRMVMPDTEHVDMWADLEDQRNPYKNGNVPSTTCPDDAEDWGIETAFIMCRHVFPFRGSRLLKAKLADLEDVTLPPAFVCVQHDTPFNPTSSRRTLEPLEWAWMLEATDLPFVVVGCDGSARLSTHPRIIDRVGTSLGVSIEILKRSQGYYGIDSCLSVLAAQLFTADRLAIKATPGWLDLAMDVYFKPHTSFPFLHKRLGEPLHTGMSNVPMLKVRCLKDCHLVKTYPKGWIGDVPAERAREWIQYGLAEDFTEKAADMEAFKHELEMSFVEAVKEKRKAKARKPKEVN